MLAWAAGSGVRRARPGARRCSPLLPVEPAPSPQAHCNATWPACLVLPCPASPQYGHDGDSCGIHSSGAGFERVGAPPPPGLPAGLLRFQGMRGRHPSPSLASPLQRARSRVDVQAAAVSMCKQPIWWCRGCARRLDAASPGAELSCCARCGLPGCRWTRSSTGCLRPSKRAEACTAPRCVRTQFSRRGRA